MVAVPFQGRGPLLEVPVPFGTARFGAWGSLPEFEPGSSSLLLERSYQLSYEDTEARYLGDTISLGWTSHLLAGVSNGQQSAMVLLGIIHCIDSYTGYIRVLDPGQGLTLIFALIISGLC